MSQQVIYEVIDRVGYITLNRPEKRNALSFDFVNEIKEIMHIAEHDSNSKILVIQSSGEAFCAGADLAYLQQLQKNTYEENLADSRNLMEMFEQIYHSKKVYISMVNGPALAGGCGLATICDFTFASTDATFGYTEAKIGFIPAIVMVFLARKISEKNCRQLLLTGDVIDSEQALELGLINFVTDKDMLKETVHQYATKLCRQTSASSLACIKEMLSTVQSMTITEGLNYAAKMNATARQSDDCKKGIQAFLNKEKLSW